MDFLNSIPEEYLSAISLLIVYVVVFVVSKLVFDLTTPYNLNHQLTEEDNVAVAVVLAGYFLGITIIFLGAVDGPGTGVVNDVIAVGGYALGGMVALNLARIINDKLVLYKFSTNKEIIEDKNPGTGVVQAASYISAGLVIAGAIHGEGGGVLSAVVFYFIGQVILIIFAWIYEKLTPYSFHDEIEKDNLAAGLSLSGGLIAIGIIIMKAISGDFESWSDHLSTLGWDVALILVYIFFVRFFFDKFIIPKSDLSKEIAEDRNVGAGLLEMLISISFAAVLYFLL
ncbi:DUF350 domain-containing protein [Flammeovirgaceae bacterium SG7u.111]|nr:DUF350 domain-containing protein [Flammeovirgaceae bacterium SG7u.132]WPO34912.1 DUF350 domain-containing protein [Flammeovirgaceae bacterium SG7u.111]